MHVPVLVPELTDGPAITPGGTGKIKQFRDTLATIYITRATRAAKPSTAPTLSNLPSAPQVYTSFSAFLIPTRLSLPSLLPIELQTSSPNPCHLPASSPSTIPTMPQVIKLCRQTRQN